MWSRSLADAGVAAHLAEPAETAAARGPKRRAKTDRADARLIRELLAGDRLPECYIPPAQILEYRALLELYHDLRREHTSWIQRIHAVLFHQGAEAVGAGGISSPEGRQRLTEIAAQLSAAGQVQVAIGIEMLEATEAQLDQLRRQLVGIARHVKGPKALTDSVYGVGPITGLALTCWLGGADRFSSTRKAVRFTGLDITVYSSAGKRSPVICPGRDRRCCAGVSMKRARPTPAAAPRATATTRGSRTASTANVPRCPRPARSSASPATSSPSSATTPTPGCEPRCGVPDE